MATVCKHNERARYCWQCKDEQIEQLKRELTAEREKSTCIEMDRDHARLDAKTERERADRAKSEGIKEGLRRAADIARKYSDGMLDTVVADVVATAITKEIQ